MPALEEYRRKRNPAATSEPMPTETAASSGNSFVIQEHHASALHWDFRLERDGVLVSWAVPKGLPVDPKVNRLAVHVEDHPLEYGGYEGHIGDGQYGAGSVTIWDSGTYDTEKWTDREVKVVLAGRRVQGRFVLFQTGAKNWMMHRMDGPARSGWLPLPDQLAPMHATTGSLPRGPGWAYEMAWSGVRAVARIEGGRIELATDDAAPTENSASRFPELRAMAERMGTTQALVDGILVRIAPDGRLDPAAARVRLTGAANRARDLAATQPVVYLTFDLLHLDGRSLLGRPYRERRAALVEMVVDDPTWQVPPMFEGHGPAARQLSRERGLDGVVAKRLSSPYRPGQSSTDWRVIAG